MLKPNKYTDINSSVLMVTYELLKVLKSRKIVEYSDLLNQILNRRGENMRKLFLPALSFLYMLNKIKYHQKEDVIELKYEN